MEILDKSKVTRLNVFDFDGTTMDTLYPEIGKSIYKKKTGNDWPHKGWWGRKESLDMNIFDFKPIPSVMSDYKKLPECDTILNVSLTGRRTKLKDEVKAILDANGYKFDRYMFNYGSDTLSNKIEQMTNLLDEFPNIVDVAIWDDRIEHADSFKEFGNNLVKIGRLENFKLHEVPSEQ